MRKVTMLCLLAINFLFASAQQAAKVSGQVTDVAGSPVVAATIVLVSIPDSLPVKTTFAGNDGRFVVQPVPPGAYKLLITHIGYQKYFSNAIIIDRPDQSVDLQRLLMQKSQNIQLKEVVVTAQKQLIENKIDRTVVIPDALNDPGTSALDILEKAPGIMIDPNGVISLEGKSGVTVYIDDKPSYLTGSELQTYLHTLPSGTLDRIELMTNPPAKYDASGTAGIINIKIKKNTVRGFNGAFDFTYGQWRYAKTDPSFNFNYRDNKLNLFGSIEDNQQNYDNTSDNYRVYKNAQGSPISYFSQSKFNHGKGHTINARLGMDYYLSDKTTMGMLVRAYIRPYDPYFQSTSTLSNAAHQPDSVIRQEELENGTVRNTGISLNYRHQYDQKGHELTADLDYLSYNINDHVLFNNASFLPDQTVLSQGQQSGTEISPIHIFAAKTDYVQPFKDGLKLEAGLKTSITHTDNLANYQAIINQVSYPDYTKSNHFIYRENINAAYVNLCREWKQFSAEAGLRLENTAAAGHQLGNVQQRDSTFNRNYTNLFPTVYLQYKLDSADRNQFGLDYGRRIGRPNYQDLNPFITPEDQFTYDAGNPFLKASFSQEIELSHSYKNNFTTKLSYGKSTNDIYATTAVSNGIYYNRPENIGSVTNLGISFSGSFDPVKWFSVNLFAAYYYMHAKSNFYTGELDSQGGYVLANGSAHFRIGSGWSADIIGSYQSSRENIQMAEGSYGRVNVRVLKKFGNNISIRGTVGDVFKTYQLNGTVHNIGLAEGGYHNVYDTRGFTLNFSYRFGKTFKDLRKHNDDATDSEQGRIKN